LDLHVLHGRFESRLLSHPQGGVLSRARPRRRLLDRRPRAPLLFPGRGRGRLLECLPRLAAVQRNPRGLPASRRRRQPRRAPTRPRPLPANVALVTASAGLYAVHIAKQPSFAHYFKSVPFDVAPFLGPALLAVSAVALGILVARMLRRRSRVAVSEW